MNISYLCKCRNFSPPAVQEQWFEEQVQQSNMMNSCAAILLADIPLIRDFVKLCVCRLNAEGMCHAGEVGCGASETTVPAQ